MNLKTIPWITRGSALTCKHDISDKKISVLVRFVALILLPWKLPIILKPIRYIKRQLISRISKLKKKKTKIDRAVSKLFAYLFKYTKYLKTVNNSVMIYNNQILLSSNRLKLSPWGEIVFSSASFSTDTEQQGCPVFTVFLTVKTSSQKISITLSDISLKLHEHRDAYWRKTFREQLWKKSSQGWEIWLQIKKRWWRHFVAKSTPMSL